MAYNPKNPRKSEREIAARLVTQRKFCELLRQKPIRVNEAAHACGVHERTVRYWANNDPQFAVEYADAQREQHVLRLGAVEDSMFSRIVKGTASAAETIFWLKRYGGPEWRNADRHVMEHTGRINAVSTTEIILAATRGDFAQFVESQEKERQQLPPAPPEGEPVIVPDDDEGLPDECIDEETGA